MAFGPVFVLYCRGPVWTTPPQKKGIVVTSLNGRPALTRYLTDKYSSGKVRRLYQCSAACCGVSRRIPEHKTSRLHENCRLAQLVTGYGIIE